MTPAHTEVMQNFSKSNNIITMWRPINPTTAEKLDDKNARYIGKSIHTKAKSSEFGPLAGEIPVEQGLSKLIKAEDAKEQVEKYNAKTQHLLEEDAQN